MDAGKGEHKRGKLTFRNKDFEDFRFHDVLKEIYQAVKRINRDNTKPAEVYVVTADDRIIERIMGLLPGIKVAEPIVPPIEYNASATKGEPTQTDRLASYLMALEAGKYAKQDIYLALEIDKANFGRLLKNERILRLIDLGEIRVHTRTIERTSTT